MKQSSSKRFGLALVSLVLSFALVETAASYLFPYFQTWTVAPDLRDRAICGATVAFDEHTGWWDRPNLHCVTPQEGGTIVLRTNNAGLRADHDYGDKAPGVIRIGVFGDSSRPRKK